MKNEGELGRVVPCRVGSDRVGSGRVGSGRVGLTYIQDVEKKDVDHLYFIWSYRLIKIKLENYNRRK